MPKIKYVGLKDEERAFFPQTGIVWTPEMCQQVSIVHASEMLKHPDVFELVDADVALTQAAPSEPQKVAQSVSVVIASSSVIPPEVLIGGELTELAVIVASGFLRSGLSLAGWNALDADGRDELLAAEIEVMIGEASGTAPDVVTITPPNSTPIQLSALGPIELKALAKTLDVKVHPNAGAKKVIDALVAAFPSEPAESKQ